jgi:CRISPR-associated protein Csd2
MSNPINHRYEFIYLFDVVCGNPNGDPDAGNAPRFDPETGKGFVSDVCLKRKIRNYITLVQTGENGAPLPGYDIYVKEKAILNNQHQRAYEALGLKSDEKDSAKKTDNQDKARAWMCQTFFDIRMFGAVMTTGVNCGQVRGPVQLAFATSIDPISSLEQTITRLAVTTPEESEKQEGGNRTMGRKDIVPYALYCAHGFINANLAAQTGFSEDDLELLWKSLEGMFDQDHSATRGEMAPQALLIFKHESKLGNAPSHVLLKRLDVARKEGVPVSRQFKDYKVTFDDQPLGDFVKPGESKDLGNGVTLIRRI